MGFPLIGGVLAVGTGVLAANEIADLLLGSRRRNLNNALEAAGQSSGTFNMRRQLEMLSQESDRVAMYGETQGLLQSRLDRVYGAAPELQNEFNNEAIVDSIINRHKAKAQQMAALSRPGPVEQFMIERLARATTG